MDKSNFEIAIDIMSRKKELITHSNIQLLLLSSSADKIEILRNPFGKAVGVVAWGGCSSESVRLSLIEKRLPQRFADMTDGYIACIAFVCFVEGWKYEAKNSFLAFLKTKRAFFFIKNEKFILKIRCNRIFKSAVNAQIANEKQFALDSGRAST